jgi:hypothetical protein
MAKPRFFKVGENGEIEELKEREFYKRAKNVEPKTLLVRVDPNLLAFFSKNSIIFVERKTIEEILKICGEVSESE